MYIIIVICFKLQTNKKSHHYNYKFNFYLNYILDIPYFYILCIVSISLNYRAYASACTMNFSPLFYGRKINKRKTITKYFMYDFQVFKKEITIFPAHCWPANGFCLVFIYCTSRNSVTHTRIICTNSLFINVISFRTYKKSTKTNWNLSS